jgi:hypothetical protein
VVSHTFYVLIWGHYSPALGTKRTQNSAILLLLFLLFFLRVLFGYFVKAVPLVGQSLPPYVVSLLIKKNYLMPIQKYRNDKVIQVSIMDYFFESLIIIYISTKLGLVTLTPRKYRKIRNCNHLSFQPVTPPDVVIG